MATGANEINCHLVRDSSPKRWGLNEDEEVDMVDHNKILPRNVHSLGLISSFLLIGLVFREQWPW